MTKRYILHLDVDAFFASVEEILDPSLKGESIIVGARLEQRSVVASASYAGLAFGVDRIREKYDNEATRRASLVTGSLHDENGGLQ